jgi:hypothetical protein
MAIPKKTIQPTVMTRSFAFIFNSLVGDILPAPKPLNFDAMFTSSMVTVTCPLNRLKESSFLLTLQDFLI